MVELDTYWVVMFKQVFDALRTTMFVLGVMCVFIGISLLAPDDSKGMTVVLRRYIYIIVSVPRS